MTIAKTTADVQNAIDLLYGERGAEPAAQAPSSIVQAVAAAAQQLQHVHEGELDSKRLTLAGELVLGHGVTLNLDGTSQVQSGKGVYSQRDGACSCPDHQHRQSYCKHLMAVDLYCLAQRMQHGKPASEAPEPSTQAGSAAWDCKEAPVSCYFKLRVGHLEMSYTMRDVDDERMAARIKTMLPKIQRLMAYEEARQAERNAQRQAPAEPQEARHSNGLAPTEAEAPLCDAHGPMRPSAKAPGTWYCPSKTRDGAYCKARWPQSS